MNLRHRERSWSGHSAASRAFAPLKRRASRSPALHRITRERLGTGLAAARFASLDDCSTPGWLRISARAR